MFNFSATHYGWNDQTQFDSIQTHFCRERENTDINARKVVTLAKYETFIAYYNALRCICEKEYDAFMNTTL